MPSSPRQTLFRRAQLALLAVRQLGAAQSGAYALYRLGLLSGHYRRLTTQARPVSDPAHLTLQALWPVPALVLDDTARAALLAEADEIAAGQVRLYGGAPQPLVLHPPPGPLRHWTQSESLPDGGDIKQVWEPARFGWVFSLGRAYQLSGNERYPAAFWQQAEIFLDSSPAWLGPHWASAQEVALRLIAWTFALQQFTHSPHTSRERQARLAQSIAWHAERIPPTLVYAQAQNNNHLLSEAAGLLTAGLALPQHPQAAHWRQLGWRWFERGLGQQITPNGVYSQHSSNYQRLMLHLALWVAHLARQQGLTWSATSSQRLAAATRWLLALVDPLSGRVPNLGPNDGARLFPLDGSEFGDYRPTLQAAGRAFLGRPAFPPGAWDELGAWLGLPAGATPEAPAAAPLSSDEPCVRRLPDAQAWAYLRTAHFHGRPGHADQLHLDLWWRGLNLALDPGTYAYNAAPPWENPLRRAEVHNTLTIDGQDQMLSAGRFLYLQPAQALRLPPEAERPDWLAGAQHDGYRHLGLSVQRNLYAPDPYCLQVLDRVTPAGSHQDGRQHTCVLHWLLPDWPLSLAQAEANSFVLRLETPLGTAVTLTLRALDAAHDASHDAMHLQIVRAGVEVPLAALGASIAEPGGGSNPGPISPVWGWFSPTYGVKMPALALRLQITTALPLALLSEWRFPAAADSQPPAG